MSGQLGFVVNKVALVQVTSVSPANSHFTYCSIFINHPVTNAVVLMLTALINSKKVKETNLNISLIT
jgi:hypothetical protein